jgi:C4-dicarboxylate-specific signal transduction histidine kinase
MSASRSATPSMRDRRPARTRAQQTPDHTCTEHDTLSSLRDAVAGWPEAVHARVRWELPEAAVRIPARAIGQALGTLVKNAIDARLSVSQRALKASPPGLAGAQPDSRFS